MAGLRNTLQIRATQTQSQILTPQMQQAIRLLQLSTIELQQQIRQTVDSNPMLELDDSDMSSMEESYEDMLDSEHIIVSALDPRVADVVAQAVADAARESGVVRE